MDPHCSFWAGSWRPWKLSYLFYIRSKGSHISKIRFCMGTRCCILKCCLCRILVIFFYRKFWVSVGSYGILDPEILFCYIILRILDPAVLIFAQNHGILHPKLFFVESWILKFCFCQGFWRLCILTVWFGVGSWGIPDLEAMALCGILVDLDFLAGAQPCLLDMSTIQFQNYRIASVT